MRAHFTSVLASMWTKKNKRVKPTDIWRPPRSVQKKREEEKEKQVRELVDRIGPDAIPVNDNGDD